ncbi:MAG: hypothetical protein HQ592_06465 [Planctomycetes bacterium]|nr:hypothetical protein [Planctomycetota bacterium]
MYNSSSVYWALRLAIASLLLCCGCVGTVSRVPIGDEPVKDIEVSDLDLRQMAREMAVAIIDLPVIHKMEGQVVIAFPTITNRTLTIDFDSATIQSMIRKHLIEHSNGKLVFLDRESSNLILAERDAKRAGQLDSRERKNLPGADFFLIGRAYTQRKADGKQMVAYHRYAFRLTNAETGIIVWENDYESKKYGVPGIGYQGR